MCVHERADPPDTSSLNLPRRRTTSGTRRVQRSTIFGQGRTIHDSTLEAPMSNALQQEQRVVDQIWPCGQQQGRSSSEAELETRKPEE